MYIIIGYDINTPLMTMYEIMTLCKHRMVEAGCKWAEQESKRTTLAEQVAWESSALETTLVIYSLMNCTWQVRKILISSSAQPILNPSNLSIIVETCCSMSRTTPPRTDGVEWEGWLSSLTQCLPSDRRWSNHPSSMMIIWSKKLSDLNWQINEFASTHQTNLLGHFVCRTICSPNATALEWDEHMTRKENLSSLSAQLIPSRLPSEYMLVKNWWTMLPSKQTSWPLTTWLAGEPISALRFSDACSRDPHMCSPLA